MRLLASFWVAVLSFFLSLEAPAGMTLAAKDITYQIKFNGIERSYLAHIPAELPPGKVPVMIFLHGGTGNAEHAARTTGLNAAADAHQFIAIYPNGTGTIIGENRRVWNAGNCCGIAQRKDIPDVAFMEMMVKDLSLKLPADPKRIYLTGMSNGAMMAYRLMCESPQLFAAVIPVSGTLGIDQCDQGKDIPLLHVHGSADDNVPMKGGIGRGLSRTNFRSTADTLALVTKARKCQAPVVKNLPGGDTETNYQCSAGAPVRLRVIAGGQHQWPTDPKGFQAAEEAWNFAKGFSKP